MNELFLRNLSISIYGGSHDPQIGLRLAGLPTGEPVNLAELQAFLARRAPGSSRFGTARREADIPEFHSGITDGKTDGDLLEAIIRNTNQRSSDYPARPDVPRPSHADYAALIKYGENADLRGGGHFSGRLTAPLCIAGGIAKQILARRGIHIGAHILQIGPIYDTAFDPLSVSHADFDRILSTAFPVLNEASGEAMCAEIDRMREELDSVGGVIECAVIGLPVGLGEHMFWGMENRIAHVAFGIPGLKGLEFGGGFSLAAMRGSEANDPFRTDGKQIFTTKNNSGGIQGGMTNGMPLLFRGVLKPTPTIARKQESVSLSRMENVTLQIGGRHDPCIPVRAVPVFEAAAAIAVLDALLDSPSV